MIRTMSSNVISRSGDAPRLLVMRDQPGNFRPVVKIFVTSGRSNFPDTPATESPPRTILPSFPAFAVAVESEGLVFALPSVPSRHCRGG